MTSKPMKLREPAERREPADASRVVEEVTVSQSKRPEAGRYLLQVDRQTKGSYTTAEAAAAVGLVIKERYPIVQVSVYDRVGLENIPLEVGNAGKSAAAEPTVPA